MAFSLIVRFNIGSRSCYKLWILNAVINDACTSKNLFPLIISYASIATVFFAPYYNPKSKSDLNTRKIRAFRNLYFSTFYSIAAISNIFYNAEIL